MEQTDEPIGSTEDAAAVGRMLADAFIARILRFPAATRRHLLIACRKRLLQEGETLQPLFQSE